jgi:hypothetical protein
MSEPLNTTTCLLVCGDDLQTDLITEKLRLSPTAITRKGQSLLPSLEQGAARSYDPRLGLDCWKRGLTGKQHKLDLTHQLEFWINSLYPVRSAFLEFAALGYWSVIDCQVSSNDAQLPSIQFRLDRKMKSKLATLELDLDFTVYRPV